MIEVTQLLLNSTDENELEQESLNRAVVGEPSLLNSVVSISALCLAWTIIVVEICGIVFNILVLDLASNFRDKVGGSKWMGYLAIWDLSFVAIHFFIDTFRAVTGSDFRHGSSFGCKTVRYVFSLLSANSSAHLVMMAVDRDVKIVFCKRKFNCKSFEGLEAMRRF